MNTILRSLFLLALMAHSQSAQTTSRDTLRTLALRVMALETQRQLADATPAMIDSLLALYSDSVVYEHPNAGAVVRGKEALRRGMSAFIGSVRAVRAETPRVTVGQRVAVVETNAQMEIFDKGQWVPVARHGIRVLEFDATGKVRRLIDYPW